MNVIILLIYTQWYCKVENIKLNYFLFTQLLSSILLTIP